MTPLTESILTDAGESKCILAEGGNVGGLHATNKKVQKKLIIALVLCFLFMILEVVGGIFANSLAILTDAAHLLSDVSGFGVSLFAAWYATRKAKNTHTFGYHRIEVLGALASVLSIWMVTGVLVYEAVFRIIHPEEVNGKLMFFLALAGCAVNVINLTVLHDHSHGHGHSHDHDHGHNHGHGHNNGNSHSQSGDDTYRHSFPQGNSSRQVATTSVTSAADGDDHHVGHSDNGVGEEENINLRGAVIHIIGDLVQSVGVALAGALIWWKQDDPRYHLADPICTFVFALLVLFTTRVILLDISDILMERVPRNLDVRNVERTLQEVPGVRGVSDLHIWGLKPSIPLLAAHVTIADGADALQVQKSVTAACRRINISHTTIQVDTEGHGSGCQTQLPGTDMNV